MEIVFYAAPMSSAVPVAIALAELEVPHRQITFDLAAGQQKRPEFLKLNPNGKVPTLVVDGAPMFESLAILHWLGETFGVERGMWSKAGSAERLAALSWTTWAYVTYGAAVHRLFLVTHEGAPASLRSPAMADHTQSELAHLLGLLEARLATGSFLLGRELSLADLIVSSMVRWSQMVGVPTQAYAHVTRWLEQCGARPSVRANWGG